VASAVAEPVPVPVSDPVEDCDADPNADAAPADSVVGSVVGFVPAGRTLVTVMVDVVGERVTTNVVVTVKADDVVSGCAARMNGGGGEVVQVREPAKGVAERWD
jgi:hypothetical protein